jgi:hypothetical protein
MNRRKLTSDDAFLSIDDSVFSEMKNLSLGTCEAYKFNENPVVANTSEAPDAYRAGMPWVYLENGLFRMWYLAFDGSEWFTCYAQSQDGYHWEKPSLLRVSYKGSCDNNIIHAGFELLTFFRDDFEEDPARRYKAVVYGEISPAVFVDDKEARERYGDSSHPSVRTFAYSPDGIQWQMDSEIHFPIHAKVEAATLYRLGGKRWFMAHQMVMGEYPQIKGGCRFVSISYSDDFKTWRLADDPGFYFDSRFEKVVQSHHAPGYQNYGNVMVGAEGLFFDHEELYNQEIDFTLLLTNDGLHWRQLISNQPFTYLLRRGDRGRWDECLHAHGNLVNAGRKTLFYYSGCRHGNASYKDYHIGVAELGLDRYGYLGPKVAWNYSQDEYEGYLISQAITLQKEGLVLYLNVKGASRAGDEVKVELLDEAGTIIEGYEAEACDNICEDGVGIPVTWKGSTNLDTLAGKRICVKIILKGINPQRWYMARVEVPWLYAFYFDQPTLWLNSSQQVYPRRGLERLDFRDPVMPRISGIDFISDEPVTVILKETMDQKMTFQMKGTATVKMKCPLDSVVTLGSKKLKVEGDAVLFSISGKAMLSLVGK